MYPSAGAISSYGEMAVEDILKQQHLDCDVPHAVKVSGNASMN